MISAPVESLLHFTEPLSGLCAVVFSSRGQDTGVRLRAVSGRVGKLVGTQRARTPPLSVAGPLSVVLN